jgi:hypothetical protein
MASRSVSIPPTIRPYRAAASKTRPGWRLAAASLIGEPDSTPIRKAARLFRASGERALEGGSVEGAAMRLEQMLHRQRE